MTPPSQALSRDTEYAGTIEDLRCMGMNHFVVTSYQKLDELDRSKHTWCFGGPAWEFANRFTRECIQAATHFSAQNPDLSNLERARLIDISLWANEIGQCLRRSPRRPLTIELRLTSEIPERCWQEDTHTLDVNRYGARMKCENAVHAGDVLSVLRLDNGDETGLRVVWCHPSATGGQQIGVEVIGETDFRVL
jgi:hypothetical protein